jgi:DNA primase
VVRAEALSLGVLLQAPDALRADKAALAVADELPADAFGVGLYRAIYSAIQAAGGVRAAGADWVARVAEEAGEDLASAVNELAVTPLPHDRPETMGAYGGSVMAKVLDGHFTERIGELRGAMKRAGEGTEEASAIFGEIIALETRRRGLRGE